MAARVRVSHRALYSTHFEGSVGKCFWQIVINLFRPWTDRDIQLASYNLHPSQHTHTLKHLHTDYKHISIDNQPGCIFFAFRRWERERRAWRRFSLGRYERGFPPWWRRWAMGRSLSPSAGMHRSPARKHDIIGMLPCIIETDRSLQDVHAG